MKRWEEKFLEANPKQDPRRAGNTEWCGWQGRTSPGTEQELWQLPMVPEATEAPVSLLLLHLVASSPVGHGGLCHLWLLISAALGEDELPLSLFPLRVTQRVSKRNGDSWRNREKESRGFSRC